MNPESAKELFDRLVQQLEDEQRDPWSEETTNAEPSIGVDEDSDEYVVEFDLSAYDTETVSARVEDRTLVVTAERYEELPEGRVPDTVDASSDRFDSQTRRRHMAREEVAFPQPVDQSTLDLTVSDGIVTVTLPKDGQRSEQSSTT